MTSHSDSSALPQTICVLGLGYIGLPTAAMFATHGYQVVGVDVNPQLVAALAEGDVHLAEPGLESLVQAALRSGNLRVSNRPQPADAYIIAVPTPFLKSDDASGSERAPGIATLSGHDGSSAALSPSLVPTGGRRADLSYVAAAAESIVPCLRPGNLVILESTVPPRTAVDVLLPILDRSAPGASRILIAHCPERVLPGRILEELVNNDRVIGGVDAVAAEVAGGLYSSFVKGKILLTDATTAEMVKLMENTFRDVNIALANEFALVAERVGIDAWEAIELANHHPRVRVLRPGPGVGGHCVAVDPWFIVDAAPDLARLIRTARQVNDAQPHHVVDLIRRAVADIPNPTVAVLGVAYKADVDDVRESPAVEIVGLLAESGMEVRVHDACARALPDGTPLETSMVETLGGADLVVILTDHAPYRALRPWDIGPSAMAHRRLLDTRNCLDHVLWRDAGFDVHRLGAGACERETFTPAGSDEDRESARRRALEQIGAVESQIPGR